VICAYSSISKTLEGKKLGKNIEAAKKIATEIGKMLKSKKIKQVAFDRNGLLYHGKVKAFADACREQGIEF
jgi:large subunit ribosomal protein L18